MKKYIPFFEESQFNWIIDQPLDDEMIKLFYDRTKKHIELVSKYGNRLISGLEHLTGKNFNTLACNIKWHDHNKYKFPLIDPYMLITYNYKCKDNGIDLYITNHDKDIMNKATEWHVKHEKHHPEYWSDRTNVTPKNDRDKFDPDSMPTLEIKHMPFIYLCEMVADWCAMSEEKGTNTPKEWADRVLNRRWKFSDKQTKQIYKLINLIW